MLKYRTKILFNIAIIGILTALSPGLANTAAAQGQTPRAMPGMQFQQVGLTETGVRGFLATFSKMRALSEQYELKERRRGDPLDGLAALAQSQAARTKVMTIVRAHGFRDVQHWLHTGMTVMMAYGLVRSGRSPDTVNAQLNDAHTSIMNNPNLTPQQRQMMMQALQSHGQIRAMMPTPANYALVKRMSTEIKAVVDK